MRLETIPRTGSPPGLWVGVLLLAGLAAAAAWLAVGLPLPVCRLKSWTGLSCPTCGSTRMVESLLRGDLIGALTLNPVVFVAVAGLSVWSVVSTWLYVTGRPARRLVLSRGEWIASWGVGIFLVLANWLYVIRTGL